MENRYYHTEASVEEYIRSAEGYDGSELIEKLKAFLPPQSTLLEIGTGPGTDWKILKENYFVAGSDNSEVFLKHLLATNPSGRFLELDAVSLLTDERFDGIYSNKVLHHLNDSELEVSIQRQHECLNPNGIICHSFWRGKGSEVFKGLFVNYHLENDLRAFFEKSFEILLVENYAEFEKGDSLLMIAKKV